MAKIEDAFSIIRNGANIKQGLDDSGYPITRIETISNRTVDRNKMGYAGVTDISKYFDYVLQNGDILMSHINSETHLGKVALYEKPIRVEYLHSDIDAIERVEILQRLRKGEFDVLVGINLLREGLDLPEVALVAILDADKEGFLRSTTSLVQTAGRTARHEKGRVILYADHKTDAIRDLLRITKAHRTKQIAYNTEHGIVPKSVKRSITESTYLFKAGKTAGTTSASLPSTEKGTTDSAELIAEMTKEMLEAADSLEFERAAFLRDQIKKLKKGSR